MSDLEHRFQAAVEEASQLPQKPANSELLRMYALYKQATMGDVEGSRPSMFDMTGRAKYDAWNDMSGMAQDEAKDAYIQFIDTLKEEYAE